MSPAKVPPSSEKPSPSILLRCQPPPFSLHTPHFCLQWKTFGFYIHKLFFKSSQHEKIILNDDFTWDWDVGVCSFLNFTNYLTKISFIQLQWEKKVSSVIINQTYRYLIYCCEWNIRFCNWQLNAKLRLHFSFLKCNC